jgi:hypothetical protein
VGGRVLAELGAEPRVGGRVLAELGAEPGEKGGAGLEGWGGAWGDTGVQRPPRPLPQEPCPT